MKNNLQKLLLAIFATLFISNNVSAQAPLRYLTHVFAADSIRGFDENMTKQLAFNGGFFGSEYHVYMYRAKRNFVNEKFKLNQPNNYLTAKPVPNIINNAPCVNEDFEASPSTVGTTTASGVGATLAGWSVSWGQNNGSCTMAGCCPTGANFDMWVRSLPWTPPVATGLGVIASSPFGGNKILQMNDNITNMGETGRIQQTFPVTASNALFQFAYMSSMDGTGHACCDQPFLRVDLLDCFNNTLACPQVSITPPGPSCATVVATGWTTNLSGYSYTPAWIIKSIDLTPYIGTCITIKITCGDCDGWAHYGMAYIDCQCLPMTITVNNIQFPAGTPVVGVAACGVATATMVAPGGLGPYNWMGPAGSGITNATTQTVTTTMAGNYTLTMTPPGVCAPITRTVNLQFGTLPNAGFTVSNNCTTYTITNTGTGAPSVQSYSFQGAGAPSSYTTTSPTSVINFAPSTTYTIYQTVTNPQNCPATFSMVITTPPGPTPAFTASPSFTQCFTGNAFTFTGLTAGGTHTFVFSPAGGAPPAGFTNPYGPVSFTAPGTYTVIHTVNSGGCVSSTQSVVVVNTVPTATATGVPPPCAGGAATLTGVGGPGTITWAGPAGYVGVGSPAGVANFQAVNNGIYTMTVNNFGCISTRTVNLTLGPVPTLSVSNTGPYCPGQPITLNFVATPTVTSFWYWSGPGGFFWNPAPTMTVANTATTTSSGVWYFYVSWPGGCWAQAQTTVQVVASPTVGATNTGPYCAGQTIQLNSPTAAGSYTWTGPGAFASGVQNPTIAGATTAMSGNYSVMIGTGSCTSIATTSVTVNAAPIPTVGSNSPICLGGTLNLTASGGATYTWTGPGAYTNTTQNPSITNVTAANAGVYTVTVKNAGGCSTTATVSVIINSPTTTATNTGPYCAGQTIQLNTPAATTYTWTGPLAYGSNVQNPTIAGATAAMSGVYTVTSTTGGCKSTATTNVVVNALPTPTASNTGPYCAGTTIQLNVGAFTTYTWTGPAAFNNTTQNPTIAAATAANAGTYTVTVTNASGCVNTSTTTVVVNPIPVPLIGSNSPVCLGTNINFTSGGGTTYAWAGPAGYTSAVQNPTIVAATLANAGVYTVTVTSLGCSKTATINVTVNTATTSASNTGPYCAGQTIQLNTPAATTYTWTGPGAFASNVQNPTLAAATVAMSGVYTVTTTTGGCQATSTTAVVVNALPTPAAANTGPYCAGTTIQLNVGAFTTYTWTGPAAFNNTTQNPTIAAATAANAGTYTVTVTNGIGCVNTSTTTVVVNALPVAIANNPIACLNQAINLTANGGATYAWTGPLGYTSPLQNPTIANATMGMAGAYTVLVTSAQGCTSTAVANVTVITLPVATITSNTPCLNGTLILTGGGGATFAWTGPGGFVSAVQNPTITNVTMAAGGTYSLIVSAGTCSASSTAVITINPLPTPVAAVNNPVCVGQAINLTGNGAVTYTWTGPGGYTATNQNPTIATAAATNAGTYTLTVTDANGCQNNTTANLTVNALPVIAVNNPIACVNQNIGLTANGGATYAWTGPLGYTSPVQNPNIPLATLAMGGAYTVLVTSAQGCTNTAVANVTVITLPVATITSNTPCVNGTLNLNGGGGVTYAWTGPGGFVSAAQNPTIPNATLGTGGTYTLIVSAGTCSASSTGIVTINPLPTPVAAVNNPVCVGQAINLTGNGAVTYTWTGPGGYTAVNQNPNIPTAAVTNGGTYTLTVTDANGCQNNTTTNLTVNTLPVIAVNNPTTCLNQTIGLTAIGGATYAWTGPLGYTSNAQNPNIPNAVAGMAGVYTVLVTSAQGCTNTAVANVGVVALPPANALTAGPVCVGFNLSLSASGGATYSWTGPNAFTSNQQNPNIPSATLLAGGIYTVVVSANSCSAIATVSATVNPLPTAVILSNNPVCVGQALNFTGNGGVNYVWTGPSGFTSVSQNPNIPATILANGGTYSLTVTDANGCVNSTAALITVNALPNANANGSTVCQNANANLSASGGVSYSWTGPGGFTSNVQNPVLPGIGVGAAGQYTVVVTDANGCVNTAFASVGVNPNPVANANCNSPICLNNVLVFTAGGGNTYSWTGPNGFMSSSSSPTIAATTTQLSGNYNVTVTDGNGCTSTAIVGATVNPLPTAAIVSSLNKGCAPLCVTFTVQSNPIGATANWVMGDGTNATGVNTNRCYDATGVYSLSAVVIDANGCVGSANYTVEVYPKPVADFNHAPLKPIINIDPDVVFTDASYGATIATWNWYFTNTAQYQSNLQNPTFMYSEPGTYAVALVVKSDKGCVDTIVQSLVVGEDFGIYVPNAFTPNGDGLNDIFQPKGFGVVKYALRIFDRWGEELFYTEEFEKGWDGTIKGLTVKDDVYTWKINATSVFGKHHELTGHVTLYK